MHKSDNPNPIAAFLQNLDYLQIISMFLLLGIGLIFIRSTGIQLDTEVSRGFFTKQLQWIALGTVLYIFMAALDYRALPMRFAVWAGYFLALILLIAVLVLGLKISGATRWLNIAGFRLQPSEPAKLAVICALSSIFAMQKFKHARGKAFLCGAICTGIPFILIAIEPDLGSALVLLPIFCAILFCYGIKWKYVILILAIAGTFLGFIVVDSVVREKPLLLRSYQRDRIRVFLNPGMDKSNRGLNAYQAKLAVGSGGLSGKGIGEGTQNELGFLPQTVANNDFIFSVIAEETGFTGSAVLLMIYGMLLFSILRTAFLCRNYGRYIAAGVATMIFCHIFINIGMSIGIAPITGLPLPLVSYGGSFTLTAMGTLGVIQSIYRCNRSAAN